MTAALMHPMAAGYAAPPFSQSRPALALVVIVHACCVFALAKLIDAHRIALREPLIVDLLETPRPEIEKPPPKKKPPEPKVEEPPAPLEKPPEPRAEEPPPRSSPRSSPMFRRDPCRKQSCRSRCRSFRRRRNPSRFGS